MFQYARLSPSPDLQAEGPKRLASVVGFGNALLNAGQGSPSSDLALVSLHLWVARTRKGGRSVLRFRR